METEIKELRLKLREKYSEIGKDLYALFLKIDKTLEKLNGE
jgi:hypothetical protein